MNNVHAKLVFKITADQGLYVPQIQMETLTADAPDSVHAEHLTAAILEHVLRSLENIGVTINLCYAQDIYTSPKEGTNGSN